MPMGTNNQGAFSQCMDGVLLRMKGGGPEACNDGPRN